MPVNLNAVQGYFRNADLNQDQQLDKMEISQRCQQLQSTEEGRNSWEGSFLGNLLKTDEATGKQNFDLVAGLDGDARGFSMDDATKLAGKAGNQNEIGGDDFQALNNATNANSNPFAFACSFAGPNGAGALAFAGDLSGLQNANQAQPTGNQQTSGNNGQAQQQNPMMQLLMQILGPIIQLFQAIFQMLGTQGANKTQ